MTHARAKRSLGQNFLVDQNLQKKIVRSLGAGLDDEVLEIGPGRGALTQHLVGQVGRLLLVELDDALVDALVGRWGGRDDVAVVHGDILEVPREDYLQDPSNALVIGNIPYNITTPIIFRLLERPRPRDIVLMVQAEVADRIVAPVGSKAYGALSVGIRSVADAKRLFKVSRSAFRPVPGVDSAIIRITPHRPESLDAVREARLRRLVRSAFQWRRKQLRRILRDHPEIAASEEALLAATLTAGVALEDRPERLTPEQFILLSDALSPEP